MSSVSIIIPTYNRAHTLEVAIRSVLAQTDPEWELIVVDDGSVDDTASVMQGFQDPRIRLHTQENKGQSAARNAGVALATSEWVVYLDSDNTLYPTYLERMRAAVTARPDTVFAFPKGHRFLELHIDGQMVQRIDNSEEEFPETITPQDIFHRKLHTDTNGIMHRRRCFDEGIRFDENLRAMEDWELLLSLSERYPDGFLYVPETLYTYSQRFGSDGVVSSGNYRQWADLFEYIYQKHKNDRLMQGQEWYPERVERWNDLADQFERGEIPPYHLWYFKDHWPEEFK